MNNDYLKNLKKNYQNLLENVGTNEETRNLNKINHFIDNIVEDVKNIINKLDLEL